MLKDTTGRVLSIINCHMMADTKDISSSEYLVLIRSPGPEIFQGYFMCIGSYKAHCACLQ